MLSKYLDMLEARVGRYRGVRNLMMIVAIGTAIVYLSDYILPAAIGRSLSSYLTFSKPAIMSGQIWRLLTFIFVPQSNSLLTLVINLYFYWTIGEQLQNEWGTFRFTVFYACGMLGSVIAGCITGYATAYYLNLSVMLAMAAIRPGMTLRFYGLIELPLKWVAIITVVMLILPLVQYGGWHQWAALIAALLNAILFFADRFINGVRDAYRRYTWRKNWRQSWQR